MRNQNYHTFDVKKCCEKKLGIVFRDGGEFNGWFYLGNKKVARITVPHGRKPIPPKTYKSMAIQLKLDTSDFDCLLDCSIDRVDYEQKLATKIK